MDAIETDARTLGPSRTDATLPADPDEVWEVLTSAEGVEGWLGEGSTLPPVEGADLDVADVETGVRRLGRVERVEPGRRLGFVWWPADRDDADRDGDGRGGSASRVEVVLSPVDDGTRLVITETPLGPTSASASVAGLWAWRSAAVELHVARTLGAGLVVLC